MPIETIIIEFQTDVSQLTAGEAKIAESMKKVNVELSKQQQELGREEATMSKLTASLGKLTGESKKGVEQLLKLSGKEVVAGFDKLGLSVDDYVASLKGAEKETKKFGDVTESGRTRLRAMREELLKLAEQGKHNTQRFRELQKEAGKLDDEIRDVQARIKATGSDTRVFDGLLNAAQGVAGGFAVAQGAAALFGDESEELQETLLRVNAAMAILQGLQQVGQVLQKESAAALLVSNLRLKALSVSQSIYTAVVGASTGALKVFRIALAATGVGLLVLALGYLITNFTTVKEKILNLFPGLKTLSKVIGGLVEDFTDFVGITSKTDREIEAITDAVGRLNNRLDSRIKILEAQDGKESQIYKLRLERLANEELALNAKFRRGIALSDEETKQLQDIQDERAILNIQNNKRIADDNKKNAAERKAALKEQLEQSIALFEKEQLHLNKTSIEWKVLQQAINNANAELENLDQTGHKVQLTLEKLAIANAALFAKVSEDRNTQAQADADIGVQFAEQAAKEQIQIDKDLTKAKLEDLGKIIAADNAAHENNKVKNKERTKEEKERDQERVQIALQTAGQITAIFGEAFKQQTENQLRQVDADRKRIDDLREVGAISEKEADRRMKSLDEKQRQIQIKGAQRDKQLAIFGAVIATAQAVANALKVPVGGFALAAIAGALGAAQIALIAARPIPKFGKGKKSRYEGLAEVGETGAELIERNGHMQVASKRQITWLSKEDKVYSPLETARMIESMPVMGKVPQTFSRGAKGFSIDYDRMGKSIAKHLPENNISFDKDGFNLSIKKGQETLKYLDKRRRFGRT